MSERITAEEARRRSNDILGNKVKDQLILCEKAINNAIDENKMSVNVLCQLERLAKKDLEDRGFVVTYTNGDFRDPRDCGYTTITW